MLNFPKSGLNETLVQLSLSLHFEMTGSDFFPMLLENTFRSTKQFTELAHRCTNMFFKENKT